MMKLLGAALIIAGCGGVGMAMCQNHRRMESALEQLIRCLEWMSWELNERMLPLGELCRGAAATSSGCVKKVFDCLAAELDAQIIPDASACLAATLSTIKVPGPVAECLNLLGTSFGRFDLQGQLAGLEATAALCRRDLDQLRQNRDMRLRNYQTLGLCAGVVLAILFL